MVSRAARHDVAIVGLGYVGITLAAALADAGLRVLGIERRREVVDSVNSGRSYIYEPGIDAILARCAGGSLHAATGWPDELPPVTIICVSTPADPSTGAPDLSNLKDAAAQISRRMPPDGLVVVRSTVPVGTSRTLVLATLRGRNPEASLAFCPERTVQGAALMELRNLPQVIGAVDDRSTDLAERFFSRLTDSIVRLSSPEAAEMVKLVNNCHTDLLYGFGNEVALLASTHGIDPLEVIRGANEGYTERAEGLAVVRPRIAKPGFVGGGCLSKDPYLLLESLGDRDPSLSLVRCARKLNESMPGTAAEDFMRMLGRITTDPGAATVLACGMAYKGIPETDDLRGTPAAPFISSIAGRVGRILGHDYRVSPECTAGLGAEPVALHDGIAAADAIVLLNDHPGYRRDIAGALSTPPGRKILVYDCWRILTDSGVPETENVLYAGLCHEVR